MRHLKSILLAAVLACTAFGSTAAMAQDRTERVTFAPGTSGATLRGSIEGNRGVKYLLRASAGQRLLVDLTSRNPEVYFNIRRSGASEAIFIGSISGNSASVTLPSSDDWVVQVYLTRNAARRGDVANYRLSVTVQGRSTRPTPPKPPSDEFGDSEASGPDWWAVTGVGADDMLNLRAGPTGNDRILARVANGAKLRNLGCVGQGRLRWCQVSTADDRVTGWASGRFLQESGAPSTSDATQALLTEACRGAVGQAFDLPMRSLTAFPPQQAGRGFEVFVQSTATTRDFNCRFGSRGQLLDID